MKTKTVKSKKKARKAPSSFLPTIVQHVGYAVRITRTDGTSFFAAPSRGTVTPVWNLGNKSYANAFVRDLQENGFDAKRVRVRFTDPQTLNAVKHANGQPAQFAASACSVFELDDLLYALENAAEFLDNEEWPEPATKAAQEAANREAAKRIRRMMRRLANKSNDSNSASAGTGGLSNAD